VQQASGFRTLRWDQATRPGEREPGAHMRAPRRRSGALGVPAEPSRGARGAAPSKKKAPALWKDRSPPNRICVGGVGLSPLGEPPRATFCAGGPYEDATSAEPLVKSSTGSPPSRAYPTTAGPNPPGLRAAQSLSETAACNRGTSSSPILGHARLDVKPSAHAHDLAVLAKLSCAG